MLRLSSPHYYACYYALLCLLHQQQQALSVTIIIDGATTNEWATRDEYQRLVDGARASQQGVADGSSLADGNRGDPPPGGESGTKSGSSSSTEQSIDQILRLINEKPQAADRLVVGSSVQNEPDAVQNVLSATSIGSPQTSQGQGSGLDELGAALDRLELIERERKEEVQQLNRLRSLEKAAEGSVMSALAHSGLQAHVAATGGQPGAARKYTGAGARTISDLVPIRDEDLEDPSKHLVERETPKKYCGVVLIDLLDFVCKSKFYTGESEPQVVNPVIKTKRSVDYAEALAADINGTSRRRRLRTLHQPAEAGGGDPLASTPTPTSTPINSNINSNNNHKNKENRINYGNNNHNQQYLSNGANDPNVKSWQSMTARYRRIRGATSQCCTRPCQVDELKPYCKP